MRIDWDGMTRRCWCDEGGPAPYAILQKRGESLRKTDANLDRGYFVKNVRAAINLPVGNRFGGDHSLGGTVQERFGDVEILKVTSPFLITPPGVFGLQLLTTNQRT